MMKYRRGIFAAVLALALLTGCGGGGEAKQEPPAQTLSQSAAPAQETTAPKEETPAADGPYLFTYQGTAIPIDADAAPILASLGEPDSYFEAASCAFDGLDKMYTYASFELDTYPMEDKDFVSSVTLRDDLVSTAEGVSIGDSAGKVTDTYGDGETNGSELSYERGGMKLCFIIENDAVSSIQYKTKALDG